MPSKAKEKKTVKKKSETKTPEMSGEQAAGMILKQLANIQSKLNDLNKRLTILERINVKPIEYSNRISKLEGRLGI